MNRFSVGMLLVTLAVGQGARAGSSKIASQPQSVRFDVNDLSYLWPVPSTVADVAALVTAAEPSDAGSAIWPRPAFDVLLKTAREAGVNNGLSRSTITFGQFDSAFQDPSAWKVAAFRVDPSAPGGHSGMVKNFGSTPQLRVIFQPVTVDGSTVEVHDVTAHLAFSFIRDTNRPPPGFPREADKPLFTTMIEDLKSLKAASHAAGVKTEGPLQVHPALRQRIPGFNEKVKAFFKRHMNEAKLTELAFMGLDQPEPWIFFGMAKVGGAFQLTKPRALGGTATAQMLMFRGGPPVLPAPTPTNFSPTGGVSTSLLFDESASLNARVFPGAARPVRRDIPDIIANPERSNVLNTDCVSCHSESSRRVRLGLKSDGQFKYKIPAGISGVDEGHLPKSDWNVRNFGWFPNFFEGGNTVATVSMRTGNESAEAVEFVNREYLKAASGNAPPPPQGDAALPRPVGTSGRANDQQPPKPQPVASPLTLVMNIKSKESYTRLKARIEEIQQLPPDKNPIVLALDRIGTVHFARFVFLSERQLAVITSYDGSFDLYIDAFVNAIGQLFDEILAHMTDAPPLPVSAHRREFLAYVKKHDLTAIPPFYSAYPGLRVLDILELQRKSKGAK